MATCHRILRSAKVVLRSWAVTVALALLAGEGPASAADRPTTNEAKVVTLRLDDSLARDGREALVRLVQSELAPRGLTLDVQRLEGSRSGPARNDARVLVEASLDVDETGWKLRIEHAASGQSVERRLAGGADADAAAIEAVAAILDSAIGAIEAGMAFGDEPPPSAESHEQQASPRAEPTVAAAPAAVTERTPAALAWHAALGLTAAGLDDAVVGGAQASVALRRSSVGLRLGSALFFPHEVETAYGTFRLQRSTLDLRAQVAFQAGPLRTLPELGPTLELVRRTDAAAGDGVMASSNASHLRAGAVAGMRWSYPLSDFAALELGVRAEYYMRSLRYSAAASPPEQIFTLPRLLFAGDLGLALGRP